MNINWYPGHMVKAKKDIEQDLKLVDIVVEVLDARIPDSSQNPYTKEISKSKLKIVVLNKFDLADESSLKKWKKFFEDEGNAVIYTNASTGENVNKLVQLIKEVGLKKFNEKNLNRKSDIKINPIIRVLIIGIPNVGKSTLINKIAKKSSLNVGNKPGVTKKKQWIKVEDNIELLDTPGLLWPKLDEKSAGIKLALTGNIKHDILDIDELAIEAIRMLINVEKYKKMLADKYNIANIDNIIDDDESEDIFEFRILLEIARKRGFLLKGNELDYSKASNILLDDLKNGRIGKISLE